LSREASGRVLLGLATLLVCGGQAATQVPLGLPLRVKSVIQVSGVNAPAMLVPIKCDVKGNVYIRGYQPGSLMAAPIVRISPDGERVSVLDLRQVSGFEKGTTRDFAIDFRGNLYLLAYKKANEPSIVLLRDNGEFSWSVQVQPFFYAMHVAVFPSGEFLISGVRPAKDTAEPPSEPFVGIFGEDGKLLREIKLPDNAEKADVVRSVNEARGPKAVQAPESQRGPGQAIKQVPPDISLGTAMVADDGNAYLMRAKTNPLIYVVSVAGEVLRRFELEPPADGFKVATIRINGGRIVADFDGPRESMPRPRFYSVFDAATGQKLFQYSAHDLPGALACYTGSDFTLVSSGPSNLILKRVGT